jgi:peptidoglycan/LPS O-acetylase OafA/YrhL
MSENKLQLSPKNRFYILDVMRFLAALTVVFYHYSIYFDGTLFEAATPVANIERTTSLFARKKS